jgi:hypothetical protein
MPRRADQAFRAGQRLTIYPFREEGITVRDRRGNPRLADSANGIRK